MSPRIKDGPSNTAHQAKKMGMSSVWIDRKGAGMGGAGAIKGIHDRQEVGYGWRFGTLGELADEVEKQRAEGK